MLVFFFQTRVESIFFINFKYYYHVPAPVKWNWAFPFIFWEKYTLEIDQKNFGTLFWGKKAYFCT